MTSDNDFSVWCWHYRERHSRVSVNTQTIVRNAPSIRALITSRNDRHVWTDWNSFTGMNTEIFKKCCFLRVFVKNTHKTHGIVKIAVINDNNNFAPSLFGSLCEFVGDCFGPRHFSSGTALPQKNTLVQNNHLRFHTMTSKRWCAVIIVYIVALLNQTEYYLILISALMYVKIRSRYALM